MQIKKGLRIFSNKKWTIDEWVTRIVQCKKEAKICGQFVLMNEIWEEEFIRIETVQICVKIKQWFIDLWYIKENWDWNRGSYSQARECMVCTVCVQVSCN